ncbi:efflux RND transporter periplasmic adaptor subunit [Catenovulum sp. 2E275]|uniref:efflux RND transporter periplasmic adaptor subunit n=1 Tax=Catenovulum sp. 2E275 TaxID=2980497 RepID=UPI0021D39D5A|nr:efflux RND transporter periplasmic adaptor subunit [Catenovulum sp. 2E275]MCU4677659.1 efflux RND transporter periplasmic adaptor subunit [Catenovulum sp. 2E275]
MKNSPFLLLIGLLLFSFRLYAETSVNVVIAEVKEKENTRNLTLTGTIKAAEHADLSSLTDGIITKLYVETGQFVNKGDILLELDAKLATAQLHSIKAEQTQAKIEFDEAKRRLDEAKSLTEKQLFAQTELAERSARVSITQANLAKVNANYEYQTELVNRHQLKAPFSGTIVARQVDVGEWINRGQQTFELVNLQNLWLDLFVPQEYFAAIDNQKLVKVAADSKNASEISAKILTKVPLINTDSRSFLVRLALENNDNIQVGLSARAFIPLKNSQQNVLTIPSDALLRHPDGGFSVFVAVDNKAIRKSVQIGERVGEQIEILTGLELTDKVITQGNELLKDNQAIQVNNPDLAGNP